MDSITFEDIAFATAMDMAINKEKITLFVVEQFEASTTEFMDHIKKGIASFQTSVMEQAIQISQIVDKA